MTSEEITALRIAINELGLKVAHLEGQHQAHLLLNDLLLNKLLGECPALVKQAPVTGTASLGNKRFIFTADNTYVVKRKKARKHAGKRNKRR